MVCNPTIQTCLPEIWSREALGDLGSGTELTPGETSVSSPADAYCRGGSGSRMTSPGGGSTLGITTALFGGALAFVALDRLILQPLIDKGILPEGARTPIAFLTTLGIQGALHRAGWVKTSPVQALGSMPSFMGFQMVSGLLLDALGVKEGFGKDMAALSLSSLPFLLASQSPMVAGALEASAAGRGFAVKGLSKGAAALQVGFSLARFLGWIGLLDFGGNLIADHVIANLWAAGTGQYDTNKSLWNLERLCMQIYKNDKLGSFLGGILPVIPNDDAALREIRNQLVAGSDGFGNAVNSDLVNLALRNSRTEDGKLIINWETVREEVKELYQGEHAKDFANIYGLVDRATGPLTSSGIANLIKIVDVNGEIKDLDRFKTYVFRTAGHKMLEVADQFGDDRPVKLGLVEEGEDTMYPRLPTYANQVTPEQLEFLKGDGKEWATELLYLKMLYDLL